MRLATDPKENIFASGRKASLIVYLGPLNGSLVPSVPASSPDTPADLASAAKSGWGKILKTYEGHG